MSQIIKISHKPTFDLQELSVQQVTSDGFCFVKSKQVFKFDNVFGNLENRSRVLRADKPESSIVEQIISATIDAGFCGPLVWKIKLTKEGYELFSKQVDTEQFSTYLKNCQQIHMFQSPAGNYYNREYDENGKIISGTSQTDLNPDITFTI